MNNPHQPWDGPGMTLNNSLRNVRVDRIEKYGHLPQLDFANEFFRLLIA